VGWRVLEDGQPRSAVPRLLRSPPLSCPTPCSQPRELKRSGSYLRLWDDAKERARENDLSEHILIPRGDKRRTHQGYIRNKEGRYEKKKTRLAVFRHLLSAGKGEVPSREDVGLD
jgi:hypothetical protein